MSDSMVDHLHARNDEHGEEGWEDGDPLPHILWGRIGALAAVVILAFLVGRMSAGDGVGQAELDRAEARAASLRTQNEDLKTQVALLESGVPAITETEEAADPQATGTDEGAEADEEAPAAAPAQPAEKMQGLSYKVRKGDNLSRIASKFYGDGSLGSFIAEANGITDAASISVGQKIIVPDRPKGD